MINRLIYKKVKRKFVNCITIPTTIANPRFRYLLFHSCPSRLSANGSIKDLRKSIEKAIGWILYHQQIQQDGGITSYIEFKSGKMSVGSSYPEVTGYIIQTLLDYAKVFNDNRAIQAALKAADFELRLQGKDGDFPGGMLPRLTGPSVFNTAQIVHGLVSVYTVTGDRKYLDSLMKACRWICQVQEEDGSWGRFNFLGEKRVYDTKVCQSLLEANQFQESQKFVDAVDRNIEFVKINQSNNGWFDNCDNSYDKNFAPLTHTIGYTIQGLLECYNLTGREDILSIGKKSADALLNKMASGPLSGRYYSNWEPAVESTCITGDAQISLSWIELYKITGDEKYIFGGEQMNSFLRSLQYHCQYKEIDGALPSSCPVGGDYYPYAITSWTVKYFTDALIEEYILKNGSQNR